MIHLIERYVVEHEEILVGIASMDVHACHAFGTLSDAGLHLQGLDDVALAEHHGRIEYFGRLQFARADFGGLDSRSLQPRHYHYFLKHLGLLSDGVRHGHSRHCRLSAAYGLRRRSSPT